VRRIRFVFAALALTVTMPAAVPARGHLPFPGFIQSRAVANYQALMRGTKRIEDLNAIELREVREIQRQIHEARIDPRTSREQCIAEQTEARGGNLSDLAARIVDLACSQR
jgi:hypothetical protein